ncbi:MAG: hypothetical protein HY314_14670 [Acidobacteria bacterium]|nr:hypothetical protein [Acidobacteriota bacterium]
MLYNMEYRIPIAGPVSVAAFGDIGSTFNLRRYNDQHAGGERPLPVDLCLQPEREGESAAISDLP